VVSTDGALVFSPGDVAAGQDVWRSFGGMELGSIWGHGAHVAPDWTADWLHRELVGVLDSWAMAEHRSAYDQLPPEVQAGLRERLTRQVRTNTYDPATRTITVSVMRAQAIERNVDYYTHLFAAGDDRYALPRDTVIEPERARKLAAFFFWSAWAAATDRPGETITGRARATSAACGCRHRAGSPRR
jgi:nitric oxide reductase subunit B